ncbi:MAG: transposase family protein [Dysgonamonadaceae bacterium]|jgi:transposase|nr:transposase family protein [Dysgonamonadaceae bacterium]
MEEVYSLPDTNLREVSVAVGKDKIEIAVESSRRSAKCPYCGKSSDKVHSRYHRVLQDVPMQGKRVKIVLANWKFFCANKKCVRTTFAEAFHFYRPKATRTDRLQEMILKTALAQSSIAASRYLKKHIAGVSKSAICSLLKKTKKLS